VTKGNTRPLPTDPGLRRFAELRGIGDAPRSFCRALFCERFKHVAVRELDASHDTIFAPETKSKAPSSARLRFALLLEILIGNVP